MDDRCGQKSNVRNIHKTQKTAVFGGFGESWKRFGNCLCGLVGCGLAPGGRLFEIGGVFGWLGGRLASFLDPVPLAAASDKSDLGPRGRVRDASKPASQPASKPASQQASQPASQQASQPASQQASQQQGGLENVEVCRIGGVEACRLDAWRVWRLGDWKIGDWRGEDWRLESAEPDLNARQYPAHCNIPTSYLLDL